MTEQGPRVEAGQEHLDVTQEVMDGLAAKLDSFGEGLSNEERVILGTVIATGMQSLTSEVKGFAGREIEIESWSWGATQLGNSIRSVKVTNAWPKSLEIGSLKAGDTSV